LDLSKFKRESKLYTILAVFAAKGEPPKTQSRRNDRNQRPEATRENRLKEKNGLTGATGCDFLLRQAYGGQAGATGGLTDLTRLVDGLRR
jgi:hypothetical protein